MGYANVLLAVMWSSVTAYALLAGADFGAGLWDLIAGNAQRGARQRDLIAHTIGPVWEANHVWLIFVLVIMWTGFPTLFAAVSSTLYLPFTLVAFGVIIRGSAFAFRKAVTTLNQRRIFGAAFALSSVVTPFFLGAMVGAVASGRVPPGIAAGDVVTSWLNPTSMLTGVFAVATCAYLAAIYLTHDARRSGDEALADQFRARALVSGSLVGVLAIAGLLVVRADAPLLYAGLTGSALPLVVVSAIFGGISLVLLLVRRFREVRLTAAAAVTAVIWGWGVAQYPHLLLPGLTIGRAAAPMATLQATTWTVAVGLCLLLPSLGCLFLLFQRAPRQP